MKHLEVITGGRRCGKTTKSLEWVEQGSRTDSYPFWSRVLVVVNAQEADRLRAELRRRYRSRRQFDIATDSVYNMVYCVEEWRRATFGREPVEIRVENADLVLYDMFCLGGIKLDSVTMTAHATILHGGMWPDDEER